MYRKGQIIPQLTKPKNHTYIDKLRSTIAALQTQKIISKSQLRSSYSYQPINITPINKPLSTKYFNQSQSPTTIYSLKQTLESLEKKINSAKKQIDDKPFKKKTIISNPNSTIKNFYAQEQSQKQPIFRQNINSLQTQRKSIQSHSVGSYVTSIPKPKNVIIPSFNPYSPRNHNIYYISQVIRSKNQKNSLAIQHLNTSINILKQLSTFSALSNVQIQNFKLNLKKRADYKNKKTLVLDMDQTLIHCVESLQNHYDLKLSIKISQDQIMNVGINIRPYCISFLKKMASKFQIIIFTASHRSYADVVLDALDPQGQIFQHRLYRDHCYILPNDIHVKDLRILNRNLSEVVLVDNAAYSYCFQLENGIPILPFYEGNDYQLSILERYLQKIENVVDVRQVNKKMFKLHQYIQFTSAQQLIDKLYMT